MKKESDPVSIHAPAQGATDLDYEVERAESFNPRPRAGGDLIADAIRSGQIVSIHAPAQGATSRRSNGAD